MNRAEKAAEYKKKVNCCQAVLLAYQDVLELDEQTLLSLGSGFGTGMGCMEATCGALCGASIAAGLLNHTGRPSTAYTRAVLHDFVTACGASVCADIKGVGTGRVLCSCEDCVRNAVKALEKVLPQD